MSAPLKVTIKPKDKFVKISPSAQMRDVASQLAIIIYGKGIHDCLGSAQTIKKTVRDKHLTVHAFAESAKVMETKWVHSMIKHAQANGVNVDIHLLTL